MGKNRGEEGMKGENREKWARARRRVYIEAHLVPDGYTNWDERFTSSPGKCHEPGLNVFVGAQA